MKLRDDTIETASWLIGCALLIGGATVAWGAAGAMMMTGALLFGHVELKLLSRCF